MKKLIYTLSLVALFISCDNNLQDYNVDPKNPESVDPAYMFSYAQYNLAKQIGNVDYNHNVSRFWANYATQTTYIQESSYDAANRDIGGSIFDNIYTENLLELKKAKETLAAEVVGDAQVAEKNNKLALITILEVYAYQYLVDNFGNVPYTEALDINNITPKYDNDEFVYGEIIKELDKAIGMLTTSEPSFGGADLIYNGDVAKWKKFAHSLQLKLGTRLSDQNSAESTRLIQAAVAGGVFTSNNDNPQFNYTGVQPYVNPIYDYFVIDSRNSDFVATEDFIALLEGLADPRLDVYYDDNLTGGMIGGVYGAAGNAYSELTHFNPAFSDDKLFPTTLMEYSTVCFELSEAAARGIIGNDPSEEYENGIQASFDDLGISSEAAAYITTVPYDASDYLASIAMQKYISLFHNGHEAWTEARRTGTPALATAASNNVTNPNRMIYPVEEVLINTSNYNEAANDLGGDTTSSKVFWDVN